MRKFGDEFVSMLKTTPLLQGTTNVNETWYSFYVTPTSERQKTDMEVLMFCKNDKYKPVEVELIGLFKKTFDWGYSYNGKATLDGVDYWVSVQTAKHKNEDGSDKWYVKFTAIEKQDTPETTEETKAKPLVEADLPF